VQHFGGGGPMQIVMFAQGGDQGQLLQPQTI
jgi:hypothetical protein